MKMDLWREETVETGDDHDDDAYDLGYAYDCEENSIDDDNSAVW